MKTVSEIAKIIGVSSQAVRMQMYKLNVPRENTPKGYLIDDDGVKMLVDAYNKKSRYTKLTDYKSDTERICEVLQSQWAMLKSELIEKDKQIEELHARLAEAHEIILSGSKLKKPSKLARADGAGGS